MVRTRNGAVVNNKPEYYGAYAHVNSTLPGQRKNKKSTRGVNTRSQEANQLPPPTFVMPKTPPEIEEGRRLRRTDPDEKPFCSVFGRNRRILYPTYHFCSNCHSYDDDIKLPHLKNKIKRTSQRYKCTAKHQSWAIPTQKAKKYVVVSRPARKSNSSASLPAKKRKVLIEEGTYIDDDSIASTVVLATEEVVVEKEVVNKDKQIRRLEEINKELKEHNDYVVEEMKVLTAIMQQHEQDNVLLTTENCKLYDEISGIVQSGSLHRNELNVNIKSMKKMNEDYVKKIDAMQKKINTTTRSLNYQINTKEMMLKKLQSNINLASTSDEVVELFLKNLNRLSGEKNRNVQKLSKFVANAIWDMELFGGLFVYELLEKAKEHIRSQIFSSENILRAMDMCGGRLSMSSIEVLRKMEMDLGCKKTIMPSSGAIKNVTTLIDRYCQSVVPFTEGTTETGGEYAEFEAATVVKLMLKSFSLEQTAKTRRVRINQAIDGAQLTTRTNHCTLGLKMADKAAIDPVAGNLLFASAEESTIQSRNNCFPLKIVFQRETKDVLETFRTASHKVKKLTNADHAESVLQCLPIESAMDSDLSATWKLCGKGGATKIKSYPCHMCSIEGTELVRANGERCNRWCNELHRNNPDFRCYHREFLDDDTIEKLRHKLVQYEHELQSTIADLERLCKQTKINSNEDPRGTTSANQMKNHLSIFFDYNNVKVTEARREEFGKNVINDLRMRNLPGTGTYEERVERLRKRLTQEHVYKALHKSLVHTDNATKTAIITMTECVPCILHLENRTGLKIMTLILQAALTNINTHPSYTRIKGPKNKVKEFLSDVADIFNTKIFGSEERRTNWHVPYNHKDCRLEDITMDNNRTRATMQNCELLINLCIADEDRKEAWLSILNKYNLMMAKLRQKDDFSDDDVRRFQFLADDFFQQYILINGRPGITNYFHMIGSGHISEYLLYYKNLYVHSQQGWEAFNSYLKVFYFRRTSRGGGRGDFNRIRQIARWLARRLVWLSGTKYSSIIEWEQSNDVTDLECNDIFSGDIPDSLDWVDYAVEEQEDLWL